MNTGSAARGAQAAIPDGPEAEEPLVRVDLCLRAGFGSRVLLRYLILKIWLFL